MSPAASICLLGLCITLPSSSALALDEGTKRAPLGDGLLSLIDEETCIGSARSANACATPRDALTFPIPAEVDIINRLDVEWRDFGHGADAEVYVNDRLVWRSDVDEDWDVDGEALAVRIPNGSTLTVRSSTGDPIWIRHLTIETRPTPTNRNSMRHPWEFPWQGRNGTAAP